MLAQLKYWMFQRKFPAESEPAQYMEPTAQSRRKAIRILSIGLVAGLAVVGGKRWFFEYLHSLPSCDQVPWLKGLVIATMFAPTIAAAIMLPQAIKLLSAERWPSASVARIQRVRVLTGRALRLRGGLMLSLCFVAAPFPLFGFYLMKDTPFLKADATASCLSAQAAGQPDAAR